MDCEEFVKKPITNIHERGGGTRTIYIFFQMERFEFRLNLPRKENGVYVMESITHLIPREKHQKCPFCSKLSYVCESLDPYKKELFHRIIDSNKLRLPWLYRQYVYEWD